MDENLGEVKANDFDDSTMTSKRWNQFYYFVENGKPKSELDPPIQNAGEDKIFNDLVEELKELREDDPDACFKPVESEW